jgi:Domain of unknown function (DUF4411)
MSDGERYLLDANAFIEAHRRYYAFDLCPGYWEALLAYHAAGRLYSIDRVRDELLQGDDPLADWVKSEVPEAFCTNTSATPAVRLARARRAGLNLLPSRVRPVGRSFERPLHSETCPRPYACNSATADIDKSPDNSRSGMTASTHLGSLLPTLMRRTQLCPVRGRCR